MVIASKPNNDRHFLSFSRKLFLSVISLFLVFAACFIAYQYQREKEYKVELLDTQLQDYNERLQQELRSIPDSLWTSTLNRYIAKGSYRDLRRRSLYEPLAIYRFKVDVHRLSGILRSSCCRRSL